MSLLVFFLVVQTILAHESSTEDALPEYLRGIGLSRVQDVLQQDLRIGTAIIPSHYSLNLTVDVSSYNNAIKSTFSGRLSIDLKITKAVRGIEIHAVGLNIKEAAITILGRRSCLRTSDGRVNSVRETITLFEDVEFAPSRARLVISYNGTAHRNGYGLFETWSRMEGEEPRIGLTTFTSPTGPRFWFPSFDEPDKKATMKLTVNHPSALTPQHSAQHSNTKNVTMKIQTDVNR